MKLTTSYLTRIMAFLSFKALRSFSSSFLILFPVLVAARDLIGMPSTVAGKSMQPTFNPGFTAEKQKKRLAALLGRWRDCVWVKTWNIEKQRGNLYPGMVIALSSPSDPYVTLVKRIVAVSGQHIRRRKPYDNGEVVAVPKYHVWVEGDNEKKSEDSNKFGPISVALVEGEVTHVLWPPHRWQRVAKELTTSQASRLFPFYDEEEVIL